jgi:NAD(P)-dependent dehydrogenase (short-subunit alcohol dehydrogenase family)
VTQEPSGRLAGKAAIISGAARGIGKGTARIFAAEGARVVICDLDEQAGEQAAAEIRHDGGVCHFIRADVAEEVDLQDLIASTVQLHGRLDILMNNAYWNRAGTIVELEPADWDRSLSVMLRAIYLASRLAIPQMIRTARGGAIINISSVHGLAAAPRMAAYEAAKAGVIGLTRQIAVDFGPQGIRSNAICPGWILTEHEADKARIDPRMADEGPLAYPVRRGGRPSDIGYAALYLASDEASFVSGHALVVDGGLTAQLQDSLVPVFRRDYMGRAASD